MPRGDFHLLGWSAGPWTLTAGSSAERGTQARENGGWVNVGAPSFPVFWKRVGTTNPHLCLRSLSRLSRSARLFPCRLRSNAITIRAARASSRAVVTGANRCSPTIASNRYFFTVLEETRIRYRFCLYGYVLMPEHFHLIISKPEVGDTGKALQVLKQRCVASARKILGPTLSQKTGKDGAPTSHSSRDA